MGYVGLVMANLRHYRRKLTFYKFLTLVSIFIACFFTYKIVFAVQNRFRKTEKTPWTRLGTADPDFRSNATETNQNEIIVLKWTTYQGSDWGSPQVLSSDKCAVIVPAPQEQKVFDKKCRITSDRRYLSRSHTLLIHFDRRDLMSPRDK